MLETPGSARSRDIGKGAYRTRRAAILKRDKNARMEYRGSQGSNGRVGGWVG